MSPRNAYSKLYAHYATPRAEPLKKEIKHAVVVVVTKAINKTLCLVTAESRSLRISSSEDAPLHCEK